MVLNIFQSVFAAFGSRKELAVLRDSVPVFMFPYYIQHITHLRSFFCVSRLIIDRNSRSCQHQYSVQAVQRVVGDLSCAILKLRYCGRTFSGTAGRFSLHVVLVTLNLCRIHFTPSKRRCTIASNGRLCSLCRVSCRSFS